MSNHLLRTVLCIVPFLAMLAGCAGVPVRTVEQDSFEEKLALLISHAMSIQARSPYEMAPAAVMPGSLRADKRFSRLEELVMERLSMSLRKQTDFYSLSRQNWFEYREGRSLTFMDQPVDRQRLLRNLIVFEVGASSDRVLQQIRVHIVGIDADGRAIPGAVAEASFDSGSQSVARRLYNDRPAASPFPEGLEERPYASLDRLTFSLASELADAYQNGMSAGKEMASAEEVRVVLYSSPLSGGVSRGLVEAIQDSLQQAIVSNRGFTCAVSQKDFGPAFRQIDFYRRNPLVFEMEDSPLTAGTVLLVSDVFKSRYNDRVGVAMRALWRASPLETATGNLIPTNVAGTYLSGFTAKAYLAGDPVRGNDRAAQARVSPEELASYRVDGSLGIWPGPARDMGVCFYEFTTVFQKRIYPVLSRAPGVTGIRRADELCSDAKGCICYELCYSGSVEDLSSWLHKNLRTSEVLPFRLALGGGGRVNVYFDGGFK